MRGSCLSCRTVEEAKLFEGVGFGRRKSFRGSTPIGVAQPLTKAPRPLLRRHVFSLMPASDAVSSKSKAILGSRDQFELKITGQSQLFTEQRICVVHHVFPMTKLQTLELGR